MNRFIVPSDVLQTLENNCFELRILGKFIFTCIDQHTEINKLIVFDRKFIPVSIDNQD